MSDRAFSWAYANLEIAAKSPAAKLVLMALADYVERNDAFTLYRTIEDLADDTGIPKRTCQRALDVLAEEELVAKYRVLHGNKQQANRYVLNLDGLHGAAWRAHALSWSERAEAAQGHQVEDPTAPRVKLVTPKPATQPKLFTMPRKGRSEGPERTPSKEELDDIADVALWSSAVRDLKLQLRHEDLDAWGLEAASLVAREGDVWTIEVQNRHTADYLTANCLKPIQRAIDGSILGPHEPQTVHLIPRATGIS